MTKEKADIAIFDIDGVLADLRHRLYYLEEGDRDEFYSDEKLLQDSCIANGRKLLDLFIREGFLIFFATSRPSRTANATQKWFEKYHIDEEPTIVYRADEDHRASYEVKVEELGKILGVLEHENLDPAHVYFIDDYPENVEAVCQAYPKVQGMAFGTGRLEEADE